VIIPALFQPPEQPGHARRLPLELCDLQRLGLLLQLCSLRLDGALLLLVTLLLPVIVKLPAFTPTKVLFRPKS